MAVVVLHKGAFASVDTRLEFLVVLRSCRLAGAYSVNCHFVAIVVVI
ncbi:hypothetical protein BACUNI_01752 [Bacteroides uniformis ATCC 8492]|uniref:Transcriptional regulator n=1 Tax=Bacteroides uniformis (strain ATCC 8492 / DSM 6597 / CCUG 4942 / CIP 103695 / JCM 5828 / KCTC 5204 / NCTC 13054 / VPI 0061) TaxID=411479 RepID=A0ABC9NE32_BACUC|nr:hypothetical protein BACUNI_01752 [Bacteroides uniformis ATCC 8492]